MTQNDCGISRLMAILGGKWQLNILWQLSKHQDIRFNHMICQIKLE